MVNFKPKGGRKPETDLQEDIMKMMTWKGWFCKNTHGNMFQSGFPDFFAIPGHRHCGRERSHVDGHDDALPHDHLSAFQDHALCAD